MESVVVVINGKRLGRFALANCSQTELRLVSIPMAERPLSDFMDVMSCRLRNHIRHANIRTVGDLANLTDEDLLKITRDGKRAHAEIKAFRALIQELGSLPVTQESEEKTFEVVEDFSMTKLQMEAVGIVPPR